MKYKTVQLTPEIARSWLETMPDYQRKPSRTVVAEYAKDMAEGRWIFGTGDAFRFNKNGQMIDGQHRCLAVIESETTIQAIVVEGLDDEVYLVLDKGRKRTVADAIGGKNANVRAAIAKALVAMNDGRPLASIMSGNTSVKDHPISATETAEAAVLLEEEISEIFDCYKNLKTANGGRVSASVATCLYAASIHLTGSSVPFGAFCQDLVLPLADRPMICTMAREKAATFTITKGKNKNATVFAIYFFTFRKWLDGETPKIIQTSAVTRNINAIGVKRDWGI